MPSRWYINWSGQKTPFGRNFFFKNACSTIFGHFAFSGDSRKKFHFSRHIYRYLTAYLLDWLTAYLFICPLISIFLSVYLSICWYVYLTACIFTFLSIWVRQSQLVFVYLFLLSTAKFRLLSVCCLSVCCPKFNSVFLSQMKPDWADFLICYSSNKTWHRMKSYC